MQRVSSVNCGTFWTQDFTYDAMGNISKSVPSGDAGGQFLPTYSTTPPTNRFTALTGVTVNYDADGNLLTDNLNTYTWNVYGSMATVSGGSTSVSATYDALGRMVEQQNGSTSTEVLYSPTGKTALMNGQTLIKGFVYLPGGATAVYSSSGLAYYRHSDWLGSSRLTSTQARGLFSSAAYSPFGERYGTAGSADASFTGQNSDTTCSLYDFLFREHSPSQGRWISPDPAGLAAVDPTSPQSWNRYAYVLNDPTAVIDPLGLDDGIPDYGCIIGGVWFGDDFCDGIPNQLGVVGFWNPNGGSRRVRGSGKAPLSPKDQKRYDKQKSKALQDLLNPDCVAFCLSHGIDPAALAQTIENQQAFNGSKSTITQDAAGVGITDPNATVAQGFKGTSTMTVHAAASIFGTDVYFHQGDFLSGLFGNGYIQEATIEHEALHNYFGMEGAGSLSAYDPAIQRLLGLTVQQDTSNIDQALKDHHCAQ